MSKKQRPPKVGKMLNGGPMLIKHDMYVFVNTYWHVLIIVLVLMSNMDCISNDIFSTYHLEENPGQFDAILFLVADLH